MSLIRLFGVAAFFALPVAGQSQELIERPSDDGAVEAAAVAVESGPRLEAERVGVSQLRVAAESAEPMAAEPQLGQSMALMIVGGAALIAGLVIGDDAGTVIALGGVVIGLIGLYHYLR